MAHIALSEKIPGVRGLFHFRPDTAKPLTELVDVLLYRENSLSRGERELIATYVSFLNDCFFCQTSHGAVAAVHLEDDHKLVEQVKKDFRTAPISSKLKSLLEIAGQVQQSGKQVSEDLIQSARREGATDVEIHDAVLIAAVFCMFNRYVDGLGVSSPQDPMSYQARAKAVAKEGYAQSNGFQRPL